MKTIFRSTNLALLLAAILAAGAVTSFAQDPCADVDAQTKTGDEVRALAADKTTIPGLTKFVTSGKAFVAKYGTCEPSKALTDWLNTNIPKRQTLLDQAIAADKKEKLLNRFNDAMKAKNWDETYASGKEILNLYPDEFRMVELVLGSIGFDETLSAKNNTKYNDDTIKFAKQSLADLEGGKEFKTFGVLGYTYKNKEDAIAWMNLTIGYFTNTVQKDKPGSLPYLYKATQATGSDTVKNPYPYELIGLYYFDELNKIVDKIQTASKDQKETDPVDVAQKKVDDIKALVAMSNGTSERAMDAFARAYTYGTNPAYKAKMKKNVEDAYNVRFGKKDGIDTWISSTVAKPFVNPTTPIQPITDPEPAKTTTGTTATPGTNLGVANGSGVGTPNGGALGSPNGNGAGAANGSGVAPKPGATSPANGSKPATTPTGVKKPGGKTR